MRGNPGPAHHPESAREGTHAGRLEILATARIRDRWERLMDNIRQHHYIVQVTRWRARWYSYCWCGWKTKKLPMRWVADMRGFDHCEEKNT
jgi:hypothetical protein